MKHEGLIRFGLIVCLIGILAIIVNASDTIYGSSGTLKLGGTVQIPGLTNKNCLGTDANGNVQNGNCVSNADENLTVNGAVINLIDNTGTTSTNFNAKIQAKNSSNAIYWILGHSQIFTGETDLYSRDPIALYPNAVTGDGLKITNGATHLSIEATGKDINITPDGGDTKIIGNLEITGNLDIDSITSSADVTLTPGGNAIINPTSTNPNSNSQFTIFDATNTGDTNVWFKSNESTHSLRLNTGKWSGNSITVAGADLFFQMGGFDVKIVGDFDVSGALSKGSGSFKIDNPESPLTSYLYHSFYESPEELLAYRGRGDTQKIINYDNGYGWMYNSLPLNTTKVAIDLPNWFNDLVIGEETTALDFTVQITGIGGFCGDYYADLSNLENNIIQIQTEKPCRFSWMLQAVRQDPFRLENPMRVVVSKNENTTELGGVLRHQSDYTRYCSNNPEASFCSMI